MRFVHFVLAAVVVMLGVTRAGAQPIDATFSDGGIAASGSVLGSFGPRSLSDRTSRTPTRIEFVGSIASGPVTTSIDILGEITSDQASTRIRLLGEVDCVCPPNDPDNPNDDAWFASGSILSVDAFGSRALRINIPEEASARIVSRGTVTVALVNPQGRAVRGGVLPPGVYRVILSGSGFASAEQPGLPAVMDWTLELTAGGPREIYVPDDYPTIQAAVDAARTADRILVSPGEYAGPGNADVSFNGKGVAVIGEAGPDATVVDLTGGTGWKLVSGEPDAEIRGLRFVGGRFDADSEAGLLIRGADATIADCWFIDNIRTGPSQSPLNGGAVTIEGASAVAIVGSVFSGNTALGSGGGVSVGDTSSLVIRSSTFRGNLAQRGGAVALRDQGQASIVNSICRENRALGRTGPDGQPLNGFGGAVAVGPAAVLSMSNSILTGNTALDLRSPSEPPASGGAIRSAGTTTLAHVTIVGNRVDSAQMNDAGGALALAGGSVSVVNSILWENTPAEIFGDASVRFSTVRGGRAGQGNLSSDPLLVDPQRGDFTLTRGSPAADAGATDLIPADSADADGDGNTGEPLPIDLAGGPRRADDPCADDTGRGPAPIPDMGAYERRSFATPVFVEFEGAKAGDEFGTSVDAQGSRVIVTGYRAEIDGVPDAGRAWIFDRGGDYRAPLATLSMPEPEADAWFGGAAALIDDWALVSAPRADGIANDSGAVFAFLRDNRGRWNFEQRILPNNPAADDRFGKTIVALPNMLIAGNHNDDDAGPENSGAVYIFDLVGRAWVQAQRLLPPDPVERGFFGWDFRATEDWLAVGAYRATGAEPEAGAVYLYQRVNNQWVYRQKLTAPDGQVRSDFGRSVAISGNRLLVGAWFHDVDGRLDAGACYVYTLANGTWSLSAQIVQSPPVQQALFSRGVAIADQQTILIGAPLNDAGTTEIYRLTNGVWTRAAELDPGVPPQDRSYFGHAIEIEGTTAFVSMPFWNGANGVSQGAMSIYDIALECLPDDCRPDLDNNGEVDGGDFLLFLNYFFSSDPRADFDQNGNIDGGDFLLFLSLFFQGC